MEPIAGERCVGGRDLTEPTLSPDGTLVGYAMSFGGSSALVIHDIASGKERQLTSWPTPRPGRGFGGGCWCWTSDSQAMVYAAGDGNLWMQPLGAGGPIKLTATDASRPAQAPAVSADGLWVAYVIDQREVWASTLDGCCTQRLDDGSADFCFDPSVTPCSTTVLWQAWNVPAMPWDRSRVCRATFDGAIRDEFQPEGAVQQPRTMPDGRGIAIRDDRGWNNIWIDDVPLVDEQFEHAQPSWGLGQRSFAVAPDGLRVAFSRNESGFGRLCVVDVETKVIREVGRGVHGQLSWVGERVCALRSGARTPTQIVLYDTNSWERTVVAIGPVAGWESAGLTEPELIEVPSSLYGCTLFARLYRASAATGRLLIFLHGGPTDQWTVTFMPRVAYWQSRGWHVLVPDHRGSSGHGRVYQQAMNARWGDLDAADTIDFARHAQVAGLATPQRTALMGGSAGGFTVLNALAREPNIAAAAVVSYPVCDLYDLNIRSHRFELHYNLNLVGPHPSSADAPGPYRDRSPIHFAERLVTPLLIHHGDADPVVPIEQSRALVGELRARAADVIFHEYAGEGHGLRQPVNQLLEYERSEAFLNNHVPAARHLAE